MGTSTAVAGAHACVLLMHIARSGKFQTQAWTVRNRRSGVNSGFEMKAVRAYSGACRPG